MEYRNFLNHHPSPVRGVEITGHTLLTQRSLPLSTPSSVSLRTGDGAFTCYDQGNLGSCTANAVAGAIRFLDPTVLMSRLYNYYYARALIGTTGSDSGAYVSDAATVTSTKGIPQETTWTYDISKFKQKPSSAADTDALTRKAMTLQALSETLGSVKASLAANVPVIIGFAVYTSMFSDSCLSTGVIPMPSSGETLEGGHCVCIWGYDDSQSRFLIRNSWGTSVGDDGFFYMSYDYYTNYAWDAWVISTIGQPTPPTLAVTSSTINIRPSTTSSNFTVTNRDSVISTLAVSVTSTPSGLSLSLPKKSVRLAAGVSSTLALKITASKKTANKSYTITLQVKSNVSNLTTTTTINVVVASLRLSIPPVIRASSSSEVLSSGTTRQYTFSIQNPDAHPADVDLSSIVPAGFVSRVIPANISLLPASTQSVSVEVTVPPTETGSHAIILLGTEKSGLKSGAGFILNIA